MKKIQKLVLCGIAYVVFAFSLLGQNSNLIKNPSAVSAEKWKLFSSEEGRFSICFPGSPEQTNIVVKTDAGVVRIYRFCVWPDDETEYSVNYTYYPKDSKNLTTKERFDAARATLKAHSSWRLEFEKDFIVSSCPGKEFGFAVGGKSSVSGRIRIVCGDNGLYQTQII